ncbi:lysine N(6)-hydroxylase/L-ornithine N(5)-oxygenase family protein [Streptomyces sp. ISL-22]|uniref:lysine N(6)-hydroxylase/L-ornithine N(5)-oxygenase family protein n=1 Tax=unclassified Streptomyces TaxID=2593676 RepID=UPI001BED1ED8|nr:MULTISPECIES: SidA/IucD/PvdA family monooxygenase [unclassified Streptomyces]MBT2422294.1 lysine N(6)-hydroxylase/L-ornithine N(5)-oxygenase family protein [Streptomyces sp. ISL-24]MBT2435986.1 lysine N(6)-hydroxylase/L-ornithine N(5)-oxygenase family protein [Streptomyces sp. ISL-22]
MGARAAEVYDVVGIGFGPSNLSLAVALEEHNVHTPDEPVTAVFLERQEKFGWHRNMLLPATTMQIPFLKDIATFRNPASRYSFVSYLHASGRLASFVNNQTFFPTRQEFHQYLEWVASNFGDRVSYGAQVVGLSRPGEGSGPGVPPYLEVEIRGEADRARRSVRARNVVVSTGLVPRMPEGVPCDDRVWHSSQFLTGFRRLDRAGLRSVAVVGAGQSAAEITRFLHDSVPEAQVHSIIPSYGYSLADDTPFANQVFDPNAVDDYYFGTDRTRQAFWDYHKNTNYSVVDDDVIRDLYRRSYEEDVRGTRRLHFLNLTRVSEVKRSGDDTRVLLMNGETRELEVDLCVFATGYHAMEPTGLLGELDQYCLRDEAGRHRVDRDYRLMAGPELPGAVYLQGGTEHTHGLSSSLLSNIAVRSGEIAESIVSRRRIQRELDEPISAEPAGKSR